MAGLVEAFLKEGYNVIATSRDVSRWITNSPNLVLIDGDIGKQGTATKCIEAAMRYFGTIDVLVNNAGIFRTSRSLTLRPKTSMPWSRPTRWDSSTSLSSQCKRC